MIETGRVCGDTITTATKVPNGSNIAGAQSSFNKPGSNLVYEGCTIVGRRNEARQYNGNLGDVPGSQRYTNCTVTGKGSQMNGSASGDKGLAIAAEFWGSKK